MPSVVVVVVVVVVAKQLQLQLQLQLQGSREAGQPMPYRQAKVTSQRSRQAKHMFVRCFAGTRIELIMPP